jgi:uncharacterized alpha-E superfamily protein
MLSRVADSLLWMSRYLERAEHTARVISVQLNLMLERGNESDDLHWARVLRSLGVEMTAGQAAEAHALAQSLVSGNSSGAKKDPAARSSIVACVMAARENARQVREQISSEMWEQVNRLFLEVRRERAGEVWDALDFLQAIKDGTHLFQGVTDSSMTHGEGWQFIQVGRALERAVTLSTLVGVHYREFYQSADASGADYLEWIGLLRSCTAFEPYCKAYTAELHPDRIAEFLVLHPSFPHSIRFSADALESALKEIGREVAGRKSSRVERIAGRLRATLGFGQIDEIMTAGLGAYLEGVLRQCGQVHGALNQTYITYPIETALQA